MGRARGIVVFVVAAAVAVAMCAEVAQAATVSLSGGKLSFTATAGEANGVNVTVAGGTYYVTDAVDLTAGAGCSASSAREVTCPAAGVTSMKFDLGDGDDRLVPWDISRDIPTVAMVIDGGAGSDQLHGGYGNDAINGGAGDDVIDAGWYSGTASRPAVGDDDVMNGGTGVDRVTYLADPVTVTIDGVANDGELGAHDNVMTDVENVSGGFGDDTITGNSGPNTLDGGPAGNDVIYGAGGADTLSRGGVLNGGTGDDTLTDGGTLNGDDGNDTLLLGDQNEAHGGPGDDVFVEGYQTGPNLMDGGPGIDTADYSRHFEGIDVTLDGVANDGNTSRNERDNVQTEAVIGTDGGDVLTGGAAAETLQGGPGPDTLHGAAGTDRLDGGTGDDVLDGGAGDDALEGGRGADRLTGGDGTDTADYSARTASLEITANGRADDGDATDAAAQTSPGGPTGPQDDVGDDVEVVRGGSGDDVIVGGPAANALHGGAGDDVLDGGAGDDRLYGGPGADTASFAADGGPVAASLNGVADDGFFGEADNVDPAADVENLAGSDYDDELVGDAGDNTLDGGAGDDLLDGGAGADHLRGGDGEDGADYSGRTAALNVSLDGDTDDGEANDGPVGARDNVDTDVEDVFAGAGNDRLTGSAADNWLDGGPGADVLVGGGGIDMADYSARTVAVTVTLDGVADDGNSQDGPAGARDNVGADVEDVIGGSGADTLTGNASDNGFDGGPGPDTVRGGAGRDVVAYAGRTEGVSVTFDGVADDGSVVDGPAGARDNVAADIEDAIGGRGSDTLTGTDGPNFLEGLAGDDIMRGAGGSDTLVGDEGADTILARDDAADTLFCDDGVDQAVVDALDRFDSDCENVDRPITLPPPTGGATTPPTTGPIVTQAPERPAALAISAARIQRILAAHGIRVAITSDRAAPVRVTGRVRFAGGRSVRLRTVTRTVPAGRSVAVVLGLTRRAAATVRRALRSGHRLKAVVTAVPVGAGREAAVARTIAVRR